MPKDNHNTEPDSELNEPKIITREKKMVDAMVHIFCRDHHSNGEALCEKCSELRDYAKKRLESCCFQEKKPVCGRCGLVCYNLKNRDNAETMFNYSGPRMMFEHPVLGMHHFLDAFRNNDQLKKK